MFLLFIDDSGTITKKLDNSYSPSGGNSLYFVLSAFLINVKEYSNVEKKLITLKQKCFMDKYSEMKFSLKDHNKILKCKQVDYKCKCDPELKTTDCYRRKMISGLSDFEGNFFSTFVNKYEYYNKNSCSEYELYEKSFKELINLVFNFIKSNPAYVNESIVLFIDNKEEFNESIYKAYMNLLYDTEIKLHNNPSALPLSINICNSKYTLGIQIADALAGTVFTTLETRDGNNKIKDYTLLGQLINQFYRPKGKRAMGYSLCNLNLLK